MAFDPNTRRAQLNALLGPEEAERVMGAEYPRGPPSAIPETMPERYIGWRTYGGWVAAMVWVLAMLVGGSILLAHAVDNADDVKSLQRQQATFESEFCEFCFEDEDPALNLKTMGIYEVPAATTQFLDGYTFPALQCVLNTGISVVYGDLTSAALCITGARVRPQALSELSIPFLPTLSSSFSNDTSTPATRCVANSTFPFAPKTQFYLVQTATGPFPCECDTTTAEELCYSYPQDMGPVNPIIDNTNMGIIP